MTSHPSTAESSSKPKPSPYRWTKREIVYPRIQIPFLLMLVAFGIFCSFSMFLLTWSVSIGTSQLNFMLLAFVLVITGSALLWGSLVFSNRILGPIYRLQLELEKLAATGKIPEGFATRKSDYLPELAASYRAALNTLVETRREELNIHQDRESDVSAICANQIQATKLLKNSRGLSLIEAMIVVVIVSVVTLSIATLASQMIKDQATVRFRYQIDVVHEEIRGVLRNPTACLATMGGAALNSSTDHSVNSVIDHTLTANVLFRSGNSNTYGDRSLSIHSMRLTDYEDTTNFEGRAKLQIVYEASMPVNGSARTSPRTINLLTLKNASNELIRCVALGVLGDGIWQRNLSNYDNIYYDSGFVGIGTSNPTSQLHLVKENSTGEDNDITLEAYGGGSHNGDGHIVFRRANGTQAAPRRVSAGDKIGGFLAIGRSYDVWREVGGWEFISADDGALNGIVNMKVATNGNNNVMTSWSSVGMQTVGASYEGSDRRLKKNIRNQEDSAVWEKLMSLRPVTFDWRDPNRKKGTQYGFIAQEVEEVWPELVTTMDDEMKTKTVDYTDIIAPLVKAARSLRGVNYEVVQLKDEIQILKAENKKMRDELEEVKKIIRSPSKSD